MANAQEASDLGMPKCPICLRQYVDPRKMTKCSHSFCETCLITYVSKALESHELGGIRCPLCQNINPAPKHKHEATDWVKSLEMNENISVNSNSEEKELSASGECDSCYTFGISTKASKKCNECFELLCVPCSMGRHSQQTHRNHKVTDLDTENCDSLNTSDVEDFKLLKQYSVCDIHTERPVEFYCKDDICTCCAKCAVLSHRNCRDVLDIQDDTFDKEMKTELRKAEETVSKLSAFSQNILENTTAKAKDINLQRENIAKRLQDMRTHMNKLLDTLDETCRDQAKAVTKQASLVTETQSESIKEVLGGLNECSNLIKKTKKYHSVSFDSGILQKVNARTKRYEAVILDLSDSLEIVEVDLKVENTLQNILELGLNETNKLANVIERRRNANQHLDPCLSLLKTYDVKKTVETVIKENYICKYSPTYSDLAFLSNGCVVLTDSYYSFCCLTNKTYNVAASCKIQSCSRCCMKDANIMVTSPNENKLYILSADENVEILHEIPTKSKPKAIHCLANGDVAIAYCDPIAFGIITYDKTSNVTEKLYICKDKSGRELKSFEYMAVDEVRKHVIQPCIKDKAVYCFDLEGNAKFKYTHVGLTDPRGVALDRDGNIYTCSKSDTAIHVISPTGRAIKLIKQGCPAQPLAIAFKKNGEEFAVTRKAADDRVVTFFKLQKP